MNVLYVSLFTPPIDTAVGGERNTIQLISVKKKNAPMSWACPSLKNLYSWRKTQDLSILKCLIFLCSWDTLSDGEDYVEFLNYFLPQLVKELVKLGIEKILFSYFGRAWCR